MATLETLEASSIQFWFLAKNCLKTQGIIKRDEKWEMIKHCSVLNTNFLILGINDYTKAFLIFQVQFATVIHILRLCFIKKRFEICDLNIT